MFDPALVSLLSRHVAELDRQGIAWCVLRNHQDFPEPRSATSDIDVLVGDNPERRARAFLADAGRCCSSAMFGRHGVQHDGSRHSVWLTSGLGPPLHVDFFTSCTWAGQRLVDESRVLAARERHSRAVAAAPGHEAAISLLSYCFHRGAVKPEYRQSIQQAARARRAQFEGCLAPVWGARRASELADLAAAGDWDGCATWVRRAKRLRWMRALWSPLETWSYLRTALSVLAERAWHPPGVWIAFLGPDGAGKTTVIEALRQRLDKLFPPDLQLHCHWRPRWLPGPGTLLGRPEEASVNTTPHARRPHGALVSVARLAYFWVDYVLGHWVRVRPVLARGGLVTFDRYAYDFEIDPLRYRLRVSTWLARLSARTAPRPELVFVLDASAAVLHARKQELPLEVLEAQSLTLRELAARLSAAHVVNVARPVDEIISEIEGIVLAYLDARNRRRLRLEADAPDDATPSATVEPLSRGGGRA